MNSNKNIYYSETCKDCDQDRYKYCPGYCESCHSKVCWKCKMCDDPKTRDCTEHCEKHHNSKCDEYCGYIVDLHGKPIDRELVSHRHEDTCRCETCARFYLKFSDQPLNVQKMCKELHRIDGIRHGDRDFDILQPFDYVQRVYDYFELYPELDCEDPVNHLNFVYGLYVNWKIVDMEEFFDPEDAHDDLTVYNKLMFVDGWSSILLLGGENFKKWMLGARKYVDLGYDSTKLQTITFQDYVNTTQVDINGKYIDLLLLWAKIELECGETFKSYLQDTLAHL